MSLSLSLSETSLKLAMNSLLCSLKFSPTCLRHYVVLPGVGGEGRGGEGREWRGIREVVVWQSEGGGVYMELYEYVPVNSGASVYSSHCWDRVMCPQ